MHLIQITAAITLIFASLYAAGCDDIYPEVVIKNSLGESTIIKDISAGGCIYSEVLTYGNTTSPMRCLPGKQKITFKKMDIERYCLTQTEYGNIDGLCLCDGGTPILDTDIVSKEPLWYNYMSIKTFDLKRGESYFVELKAEEIEQDFSVPGPYGH